MRYCISCISSLTPTPFSLQWSVVLALLIFCIIFFPSLHLETFMEPLGLIYNKLILFSKSFYLLGHLSKVLFSYSLYLFLHLLTLILPCFMILNEFQFLCLEVRLINSSLLVSGVSWYGRHSLIQYYFPRTHC